MASSVASASVKPHFRSRPSHRVRIVAKIRSSVDPELEFSHASSLPRISVQKPHGESSDGVTISFGDEITSCKESYKLDYCYEQDEHISQIFCKEVRPLLPEIFHGFNASIIAYGARGSGKTSMMKGCYEKPGLAPLAVAEILLTGGEIKSSVMISYYEVYQDHVYDLLEPKKHEVSVLEDNRGRIQLKGLSQVPVKSVADFNRFFFHECNQRKSGQKVMSDALRRSHRGLIVHVSCNDEDSNIPVTGKINFIDLAGYEDTNRRVSNGGPLLTESAGINKSLYTLQKVVYSLNANEAHVPYRETKLTRMLQDSMGGTSRALMITCLAPTLCQDAIYTVKLASQSCQARNQVRNDCAKTKKGIRPAMPLYRAQTMSTLMKKSDIPRFLSTEKKIIKMSPATKGRKKFNAAITAINFVKENSVSRTNVIVAKPFTSTEVWNPIQENSVSDLALTTELSTEKEENSISSAVLATEPFIEKEENPSLCVAEAKELSPPVQENPLLCVAEAKELSMPVQENPLLCVAEAKELSTPVQDAGSQKEWSHSEINLVGLNAEASIGIEECNLEKSKQSPCTIGGFSPPISARLRDITNTLKSLCSPIPLGITPNDFKSREAKDLPQTPGVPFSLRAEDNIEKETAATTGISFKTRSCGLKKSLVQEYLKFLNTAGKEELKKLKGIGEKRANYILELREEHPEPFTDLQNLKEIGLSSKQINGMIAGELFP